jgi:hypothetical protein
MKSPLKPHQFISHWLEEVMHLRILAAGIAIVLCLQAPAAAEMYKIDNPASNIYNPATRMDKQNPLSPPSPPVPPPTVPAVTTTTKSEQQIKEQPQTKPVIPKKSYKFKTVEAYIDAANKAFIHEDYISFLSFTEDALRRINAGTLIASKKLKQKLDKYKAVGYGLLENK